MQDEQDTDLLGDMDPYDNEERFVRLIGRGDPASGLLHLSGSFQGYVEALVEVSGSWYGLLYFWDGDDWCKTIARYIGEHPPIDPCVAVVFSEAEFRRLPRHNRSIVKRSLGEAIRRRVVARSSF